MYILYSELIKKILLKLSFIFRKLVAGNFKFLKIYYDNKINCLMVSYRYQDKEHIEKINTFTETDFFTLLSKNDLNMIINAHIEISSKSKLIALERDLSCPDVITVVNTSSSQKKDLLIKDIYLNDFYLENMSASDIRILCQSFISNNIEDEALTTSFTGENIINFNMKKIFL